MRTAVVSSSDDAWIARHLGRLGRLEGLDTIVAANGDTERAKPRPDLYVEALDRLRERGPVRWLPAFCGRDFDRAVGGPTGLDDFLAEATPEDKLALIKREQEGGAAEKRGDVRAVRPPRGAGWGGGDPLRGTVTH